MWLDLNGIDISHRKRATLELAQMSDVLQAPHDPVGPNGEVEDLIIRLDPWNAQCLPDTLQILEKEALKARDILLGNIVHVVVVHQLIIAERVSHVEALKYQLGQLFLLM